MKTKAIVFSLIVVGAAAIVIMLHSKSTLPTPSYSYEDPATFDSPERKCCADAECTVLGPPCFDAAKGGR
jgi:hypothetical protein